jgi:hypothetical protein
LNIKNWFSKTEILYSSCVKSVSWKTFIFIIF